MNYKEIKKELKKYGYTRSSDCLSKMSNGPIIKKNFSDRSLNHTRLLNSTITKTNFNNAAMTGSYFNNCEFKNCKMNMTDFEYCEFYDCTFYSRHKVICSFNESNFLNVHFNYITFSGCSFSGVLFENCKFDNVKIEFTTLENALFRNCTFCNMDMKVLNLNYVEFETPKMDNTILPLEQIPHAIGVLEYCMHTTDNVKVASDTAISFSMETYLSEVIPLLEEEYEYKEDYFPLANICLANGKYEKAYKFLHKGLETAVAKRDFRMLKFFCRLILNSHRFNVHDLHGFYHSICRLSPQGKTNSSLMRNYVRNIGEIKNILFDSTKQSALHITFLTNLSSKQSGRLGELLSRILGMIKAEKFDFPNTPAIKITENSPLLIEISVHGTEENIALLLPALLSLANTECQIPMLTSETSSHPIELYRELENLSDEYHTFCTNMNIVLTTVEYYLENCSGILPPDQNVYYYNSDLKQYNKLLSVNGG